MSTTPPASTESTASTESPESIEKAIKEINKIFNESLRKYSAKRKNSCVFHRISLLISEFVNNLFYGKANNFDISSNVYERLMLRHALLKKMEKTEGEYNAYKYLDGAHKSIANAINPAIDNLINSNASTKAGTYSRTIAAGESDKIKICMPGNFETSKDNKNTPHKSESLMVVDALIELINTNPAIRGYKLATTDLFVEKAIAYLEVEYDKYFRIGKRFVYFGNFFIFVGMVISGYIFLVPHINMMFSPQPQPDKYSTLKFIMQHLFTHAEWLELVRIFISGFTFYGFIVLFSVGCWRVGRAMLDQAERLKEKRHSLRQGRLFIHLNNGIVTVEQLEKAFDWNVSKNNAFGNIQTEASAPWGGVLKEALKAIPEIFRRTKDTGKSTS